MSAQLSYDYDDPRPLSADEQRLYAVALESREEAVAEINRALYWNAEAARRLRTRRERIVFGCDYLRRRLRRLPIERPAVTFYSIEEAQ